IRRMFFVARPKTGRKRANNRSIKNCLFFSMMGRSAEMRTFVAVPEIMLLSFSFGLRSGYSRICRALRLSIRLMRFGFRMRDRLLGPGVNLYGSRHSSHQGDVFGFFVKVYADGDALGEPHPREDWIHLRKPGRVWLRI